MRLLPRMTLLALVSAAALAGCSGTAEEPGAGQAGGGGQSAEQPAGEQDATPPDGGDTGGGAAIPAPSQAELLGKKELAQGARIQQLDVKALTEQLNKVAKQAKFEPAECGTLATSVYDKVQQQGAKVDGVGMIALVGASSISEAVIRKPPNFKIEQDRAVLRKCATVRSTIAGRVTTARTTPLELDGVRAQERFAFTQVTDLGGKQKLHTITVNMATENRIVVVALTGTQAPPQAELVRLANVALTKVKG